MLFHLPQSYSNFLTQKNIRTTICSHRAINQVITLFLLSEQVSDTYTKGICDGVKTP